MIQISTSQFEGPFDLLLGLIDKKKIDIFDIQLKDITEEYLKEIEDLKNYSSEEAADFLYIASTLLEIKSRSLLPIEDIEDEDEIDLLERLIEYKKYKVLSLELKNRIDAGMRRFYKYPEDLSLYQKEEIIINTDKELLFTTLMFLIQSKEVKTDPLINFDILQKDEFSVEDQMDKVCTIINNNKIVDFRTLIKDPKNINEKISTFLAILELIRMNYLYVYQSGNKEIRLELRVE